MKIDEGSINHNALRFISELVESRYEFLNGTSESTEVAFMAMTRGEIGAICDFAEALKEVLRS